MWQDERRNFYQEKQTKDAVTYYSLYANGCFERTITPNSGQFPYYYYLMNENGVRYSFYDGKRDKGGIGGGEDPCDTLVRVTPSFIEIIALDKDNYTFHTSDYYYAIKRWIINLNGDRIIQTRGFTVCFQNDGTVFTLTNLGGIQYTNENQIYFGGISLNESKEGELVFKRYGEGSLFFDDGELMVEGYWDGNELVRKYALAEQQKKSAALSKALENWPKYKNQKIVGLSPSFSLSY